MAEPAIIAQGLSKRYRLGRAAVPYVTLRDTLAGLGSRVVSRLSGNGADSEAARLFWALKDVSFEVKEGEAIGIVGRNGAGKTTLLKVLSRITEPTEGRAELRGRIGSLLEVGTGFHPELTGRENVFLSGAILGMHRHEMTAKFDEIVAFAAIEKFIDTPVKFYSSGMYVRLAFAVAAHLELDILLVDEVLAVGDLAFQKKCLAKMEDVAVGGRTVMFVSHHMFTLQSFCTRGLLLEDGALTLDDTMDAVIQRYVDGTGRVDGGEVSWTSPETAPGNDRLRLHAVRIKSGDRVTSRPDVSKQIRIEVDYWNLDSDCRRVMSVHVRTPLGGTVLSSANFPSMSISPDPWYDRTLPAGTFRTSCTLPESLLNDETYSVSVYFTGSSLADAILSMRDVISFSVQDNGEMREEYKGHWVGVVRPRLDWSTVQLEAEQA